MKVLQQVGRLAGYVVEMPFAEATACLACGTALPVDQTAEVGSRPGAAPTPQPVPQRAVERVVDAPVAPEADDADKVRAVLDTAADSSVRFLTFKSAAAEVLGPDLPAKKADIVAALEARLA